MAVCGCLTMRYARQPKRRPAQQQRPRPVRSRLHRHARRVLVHPRRLLPLFFPPTLPTASSDPSIRPIQRKPRAGRRTAMGHTRTYSISTVGAPLCFFSHVPTALRHSATQGRGPPGKNDTRDPCRHCEMHTRPGTRAALARPSPER